MAKYRDFPNILSKTNSAYVYDADVVRQNLERLLTTEKGSVIDNPEYGIELQRYLYDPMVAETDTFIEMEIERVVDLWMSDQVTLRSVNVNTQPDQHSITVSLVVYMIEFDKEMTFQVPYEV